MTASARLRAVAGDELCVKRQTPALIWWSCFCSPQPLGSFPHVCPHRAVRLSGGSQLHLGDSEAGLQEDALPGKSVRPVQPQLLSKHEFTSCCPHPAADRHADHDRARLVFCIDGSRGWGDGRGEEGLKSPSGSVLWSSSLKPRI